MRQINSRAIYPKLNPYPFFLGGRLMMETRSKSKAIASKYPRLLIFLLLYLQPYLVLAVPQNSIVVSGIGSNIGIEPKVSRKYLSLSVNLVGKHEIKAVQRGGGAVGGGGEYVDTGDAAGGKTKSSNKRGGALIPVYAAGANRHRQQTKHHRVSSSDIVNCIGSGYLVLILFTSFFFMYSM
ncbi:uncharacterized protein LOC120189264 isoform X1 [Hibiscus syriacus]|uniref:uncharacterized protein LOC120189264 isoform X1 n=1 Tax=Hibiscus syriacus TaxID=106335 RepID=UPI0019235C8E|nr:uncharacterized protein LOC120189264 isoform X1 [Hibiscus syriacus]